MKVWAFLTRSSCANTTPAPSNKAPTTTTVRIIGLIPLNFPIAQSTAACELRLSSFKHRGCRFIPAHRKISEAMPALMLADRDPDPFRGCGHIDVIDLVFTPQPLDNRVDNRRTGADRAGLARALDAQRIGLAGHVMGLEHE